MKSLVPFNGMLEGLNGTFLFPWITFHHQTLFICFNLNNTCHLNFPQGCIHFGQRNCSVISKVKPSSSPVGFVNRDLCSECSLLRSVLFLSLLQFNFPFNSQKDRAEYHMRAQWAGFSKWLKEELSVLLFTDNPVLFFIFLEIVDIY